MRGNEETVARVETRCEASDCLPHRITLQRGELLMLGA
jgi:hypothetical protein